jgi:tetratricopeptide (TPR) repeat protein
MNSSREWGDNLEQASVKADPELRRRLLRGTLLLLATVIVAASVWAGWRAARRRCEPLLEQARILVKQALDKPSEWNNESRTAEALLREYLARRGPNEDVAELLLCATLTLRGSCEVDEPIGLQMEIEQLLNKIKPSACTTEDLLTAIHVFIHSGKVAQADWLLGAALKSSEGSEHRRDVLRLAADLRYDLGMEEEVLEHCTELAEIDPSDPEPWRLMAMVHEDAGYDERLIESLRKVIELAPDDAGEDRLKLINSLITVGDRAQARAQLDVLQARAPDLLAANPVTKAKLLLLEGKTREATAIIDRMLAENPQAIEALLLRGQLLLSQNELDEAAHIMERLLGIDPMNFQAHYVLGQTYARRGERERAQEHLAMHRRILDTRVRIHSLERRAGRNPRDTEARLELVRLYEELGMTDHANFWRRASASSGHGGES